MSSREEKRDVSDWEEREEICWEMRGGEIGERLGIVEKGEGVHEEICLSAGSCIMQKWQSVSSNHRSGAFFNPGHNYTCTHEFTKDAIM